MFVILLVSLVVAYVVLHRSCMSLLEQIPDRNRDFIAFTVEDSGDRESSTKANIGQRAGHCMEQVEIHAG